MPRKRKHPLCEVRNAIEMSQPQFAKMFGVSASYIQAIELGQRGKRSTRSAIYDQLCDDIALRLGVIAESLKQERGMPTALLGKKTIAAMTDRATGAAILSELRRLEHRPRKRLRYQIDRWRKMLPAIKASIRSQDILRKLFVFVEAAGREKKELTALCQLDRWIENQVAAFNLRTTVKVVAQCRGFDWRPFNETLLLALPILSPQQRRRKKR